MKLCLVTDCLGAMSFDEMLETAEQLGYQSLEIACGGWSPPRTSTLIGCWKAATRAMSLWENFKEHHLQLEVLNCSGNHLAPNDEGKEHEQVVEKTFRLAALLGIIKLS
jgi:sugar phosphate isomerase/epimerase